MRLGGPGARCQGLVPLAAVVARHDRVAMLCGAELPLPERCPDPCPHCCCVLAAEERWQRNFAVNLTIFGLVSWVDLSKRNKDFCLICKDHQWDTLKFKASLLFKLQ